MFRFVCTRNVQQIRPLKITTRVTRQVRQSPKESISNEADNSELRTLIPGTRFDSFYYNSILSLGRF